MAVPRSKDLHSWKSMDRVLEKTCTKCGEVKPIDEFYKQRSNAKYPYRLSYCKRCKSLQSQLYRVSSPEIYIRENINRTRRRCKKKDVTFEITYDYAYSQYLRQNKLCFYTDKEMLIKALNGLSHESMSLDKIIPELGYVEGNIVWCRNKINTVKNNLSLEEIEEWMPGWYERIMRHKNGY